MRMRSPLLGLVVITVALGVSELVDGLFAAGRSPVVSVAEAFVDLTPAWLKDWGIRTFGTADKVVLVVAVVAVVAIVAVCIGVLATRRLGLPALATTLAIGVVGCLAVLSRPGASAASTLPTIAGTVAALGVLRWYWRGPGSLRHAIGRAPARDAPFDRRSFVTGSLTFATMSLAAAGTGRTLARRFGVAGERGKLVLPPPDDAAGPLPGSVGEPAATAPERPSGPLAGRDESGGNESTSTSGEVRDEPPPDTAPSEDTLPGEPNVGDNVQVDVPGMSSFVTSNKDFYRIDTAISVPQLRAADWRLRVHGMVDRELTLTFADLLARSQVERYLTLSCVSNEVGGMLAGNALWQGALLGPILAEAGVRAGAEQLVSRSIDGWTCGTPVADVMDGRDAMLAIRMNREALPASHGYPVRMIVPGLYGYVSATKWVVDLEVTTWEAFDAYWVPRGYAQQAPVKTASRIDVPRNGAVVKRGRTAVAGVAWHPHVGISQVQVRIDGGDWVNAELAAVPSRDTWRQWVYRWDATPGGHIVRVRAIDGSGRVQDYREVGVLPDGATGYHSISVQVTR